MFLKRLKGDKMKKNVSFMLCYLVFLSPIVGTEVMKSSEHATKPKGDMIISDEACGMEVFYLTMIKLVILN